MPNPDASREAAHRRYEAAQEISQNNPDVSLDEALAQKTWNVDWQPGDPTYQEVQENWDYYSQLTNGGQVPISEAVRQQRNAGNQGITSARSYYTDQQQSAQQQGRQREAAKPTELPSYVETVSGRTIPINQPEANSSANVSISDVRMSPSERAERDESERDEQRLQQQSESLQPSVQTSGSQKSLQELQDDLDKWLSNRRPAEDRIGNEIDRRFTDLNTGEVLGLPDWNLLGFTSQQETPDAVKNIYDYHFAQEDANPIREGSDEWNARRGTWGKSSIGRQSMAAPSAVDMSWGTMGFNPAYDPMYQQQMDMARQVPMESVVDENAIDNGLSPESRESLYMNGPRYLQYVTEYGLPGRDPSEISNDPNVLYNKQYEMEENGFVPYLTEQGIGEYHNDSAADFVNNVFNNVADLRRNNTTYSYDYDGNSYDAKDFDSKYDSWLNRVKSQQRQERQFDDPSKVTEDSVPLTWVLHDSVTGEDIYAPGNGEWDIDEYGKPVYRFGGDPDDDWYFDDENDFKNSVKFEEAGNNRPVMAWQNIEPLVLDDGQKIRADKAMDIYRNKDSYANYGWGNIGRPSVEDPFKDRQGNFNLNPAENSFLPWITDVALGSVPLFFRPTAAAQALGNSYANFKGFKPGYQNSNGEYRLLSEDPSRLEQLTTTTGSAILPGTERIWGNIGKGLTRLPGMKWLSRNHPEVAEHPLTILGTGATGEVMEEIPGNLVEEMQSATTPMDYFANPLYYDEDGNLTTESILPNGEEARIAYDSQGKQLRDRSTGFFDRNANFWSEAPLSMLGGGVMGGVTGAGEAVASIRPYTKKMRERENERNELGYNLIIPEEVQRYTERQQAGE